MNDLRNTKESTVNRVAISNITVLKETWENQEPTTAKWQPATPKLEVHYYIPAKPKISPQKRVAIMASAPVVISLVIGIIAGSFTVWESRYGEANRLAQLETAASLSTESFQPSEPWVKQLEFDQSELNVVAELLEALIEEYRHKPTAEELANEERKNKLRAYFEKRKSPFAKEDQTVQAFLDAKNMKLMIAISFVESTMGKRCYYNNCSGIGGYPPNLRKYDSYAGWVKDFDSLLERRYKGMKPEEFLGVYVQPGSPNWINGVKQILAELEKNQIE